MTDWKPGDEFELNHSGTIRGVFDDLVEVKHEGFVGPNYYQQEWFDDHATKIQPPLQFGEMVWVRIDGADFHKAVVIAPGNNQVAIWVRGAPSSSVVSRTQLSSMQGEAT